jgi:hypothetical protein
VRGRALKFIDGFENAVAHEAARRGLDGAVCGHIHSAGNRVIGGIRYVNCGDWVESCTAAVEHEDGSIGIIDWGSRISFPRQADGAEDDVPEDSVREEAAGGVPVLAAAGQFAHFAATAALA